MTGAQAKRDPVMAVPVVLAAMGLVFPLLGVAGWIIAEVELYRVGVGTVTDRGVGGLWFARIVGLMATLIVVIALAVVLTPR